MEFFRFQNVRIACAAPGDDPHATALALLEALHGGKLPPIRRTALGKPHLEGSPLHISVSHTPRHVFCCISPENVGLDAEEADRIAKPVYLSANEQARLAASKNPQQDFLRLWVLKESYAKLTGKGIGSYLKETDFSPDDPRITEIDGCFVAVITEKG